MHETTLETGNCFEDEKGIEHHPPFVASFFDSVDGCAVPGFDFDRMDRPEAEHGTS